MSDQSIIEQCAPTLAGLKTGSLFSVKREPDENITEEIRKLNGLLREKGLRAIPVRNDEKRTLIYLYRPKLLEQDLKNPEAEKILAGRGYTCSNANICLLQLIRHLSAKGDFPHEIGLFLGYPAEDVKGFISHPNEGVKCVGCWKVYTDKERAERIFCQYKRCTEIYKQQYQNGKPFSQLIVAAGC